MSAPHAPKFNRVIVLRPRLDAPSPIYSQSNLFLLFLLPPVFLVEAWCSALQRWHSAMSFLTSSC